MGVVVGVGEVSKGDNGGGVREGGVKAVEVVVGVDAWARQC